MENCSSPTDWSRYVHCLSWYHIEGALSLIIYSTCSEEYFEKRDIEANKEKQPFKSRLIAQLEAYEAADYATGPTEIRLNSTELEGIIKWFIFIQKSRLKIILADFTSYSSHNA